MRFSASVTSVSWIPSEAIRGYTRMPFELGVTHYDDPPPEKIADIEAIVGPEGARFANRLSAWIEVEDGRIVGYGQEGHGRVSHTAVRIGGMRVLVEAVPFPELRPEPVVGTDEVRFVQTAGGRPGLPAPRLVSEAPYVKIQGPTVWTTLALTMHADGTSARELLGGSTFPRHWIYDSDGQLSDKSAVIDFKTWYRTSTTASSPWGNNEVEVASTPAETALERRLSTVIMRHGHRPPKPKRAHAGTVLLREGDAGDDLILVLDGLMAIEVGDQGIAQVGPGSLLGERAHVESGRRTATVRALTDCRIVEVPAKALPEDDLRELAQGHRREEESPSKEHS
jgi:Cyclic nucleotide-binding domain